MSQKMKVALIPNDFSMDLEAVCKLCQEEHVQYVELGYMWNKSILDLNSDEQTNVHALLDKYGLKVASIQTQIMKCMPPTSMLNRPGSKNMHFDYAFNVSQIDRAISVAKDFHAPYIVSYSYFKRGAKVTPSTWDKIIQDYQSFIPKLKDANKTMVVECEPDTVLATVNDYLKLFDALNSPHVQANLDLANLIGGQKKFPQSDFDRLYAHVPYFHVKDRAKKFLFGMGSAVFSKGVIPWKTVLPWFASKGFAGYLSVEPHVHGENRFELGRQCVQNLQKVLTELGIAFE